MRSKKHWPTVTGTVSYEKGKNFIGGGDIQEARAHRIGDEFVTRESLVIIAGGSKSNRDLTLNIDRPSLLPGLIADLALEEPEEAETADEFSRRLAFRDDLAKAFEEAASRLRSAPRR